MLRRSQFPMGQHFKLSVHQAPRSEVEINEKQKLPYASMIGSIMYAMISTRPDIAQAVSITSSFMSNHGKEHWLALKWLMRYMKGASDIGILFDGANEVCGDALVGWSDSDFAGNIDTRRSQSGYVFTLYGAAVSWKSSLQSVVALSTTEAEFMALTAAVKESYWLRGILKDFGVVQESVAVGCDNNSALCVSKHQVYHERSKHIDVHLHFIREKIDEGEVKVFKVDTTENPADMLTKPVSRSKLGSCMKLVSLCKIC
ncbi:secreted RxLR effector protein 161-like [Salvia hispanica]|uniref:secreted RxLR effector protein 161-like n=1 Tax=Salvia hispanica TaxID=49212 RepID=UPI002009CAEE|nr:secreted RxLR effector protein 161-like [Salvia hispanica]